MRPDFDRHLVPEGFLGGGTPVYFEFFLWAYGLVIRCGLPLTWYTGQRANARPYKISTLTTFVFHAGLTRTPYKALAAQYTVYKS